MITVVINDRVEELVFPQRAPRQRLAPEYGTAPEGFGGGTGNAGNPGNTGRLSWHTPETSEYAFTKGEFYYRLYNNVYIRRFFTPKSPIGIVL